MIHNKFKPVLEYKNNKFIFPIQLEEFNGTKLQTFFCIVELTFEKINFFLLDLKNCQRKTRRIYAEFFYLILMSFLT